MRVLVFVNHPAHVHLFKNMVWNLQGHGHTVKILAHSKPLEYHKSAFESYVAPVVIKKKPGLLLA